MQRGFLGRLVFHAEDDGGSGGGENKREKVRATDVHERFSGDAMRMAEKFAEFQEDNYQLREKNRQLKADLDAAAKRVPADGAVVLSADDAKAWDAYQKLGTPADVEKAVTDGKTSGEKLAALERNESVRAAAAAEQLNADALLALPNLPAITLKDVKDGEATVKRAFVTIEGGQETALRDFGKQTYAALWPAVEATGEQQQAGAGSGRKVPAQSSESGTGNARAATVQGAVKRLYSVPGQKKQ